MTDMQKMRPAMWILYHMHKLQERVEAMAGNDAERVKLEFIHEALSALDQYLFSDSQESTDAGRRRLKSLLKG